MLGSGPSLHCYKGVKPKPKHTGRDEPWKLQRVEMRSEALYHWAEPAHRFSHQAPALGTHHAEHAHVDGDIWLVRVYPHRFEDVDPRLQWRMMSSYGRCLTLLQHINSSTCGGKQKSCDMIHQDAYDDEDRQPICCRGMCKLHAASTSDPKPRRTSSTLGDGLNSIVMAQCISSKLLGLSNLVLGVGESTCCAHQTFWLIHTVCRLKLGEPAHEPGYVSHGTHTGSERACLP